MFGFRGDNFIAVITCVWNGVEIRFWYQIVAKVMSNHMNIITQKL